MVSFTHNEKRDLAICIIVITVLFAYVSHPNNVFTFLILLPVSFFAVGIGFILHELGHKYVAQKYGYFAEFKRWDQGLILAIITSFLGFIFLAPGAVYIYSYTGMIPTDENGKISIAGPVVNIILAIIFLLLELSIMPFTSLMYNSIFSIILIFILIIGVKVNSFLALFNLIPILNLDGAKILRWNKIVWVVAIIISAILLYLSYTITLV